MKSDPKHPNVYDFSARSLDGSAVELGRYRGQVALVVNVASRCGFTPQYAGLEALYQRYRDQGFVVLGFPCNQFGKQEAGTEAEIKTFCDTQYRVTFPMFAKIDVNGANAAPLYTHLKATAPGLLGTAGIKWNFTKFLVSRDGTSVVRFSPQTTPEALDEPVLNALKASTESPGQR